MNTPINLADELADWQATFPNRTASEVCNMIGELRQRLAEIEANPQIGTCCICGAAIWRNEARMTDDRGEFHPMCAVEEQLAEREAQVERLRSVLKDLYEHDADYIKVNNLGHPNHNLAMWNAYDELEHRKEESPATALRLWLKEKLGPVEEALLKMSQKYNDADALRCTCAGNDNVCARCDALIKGANYFDEAMAKLHSLTEGKEPL
jgi:hypothetical protein